MMKTKLFTLLTFAFLSIMVNAGTPIDIKDLSDSHGGGARFDLATVTASKNSHQVDVEISDYNGNVTVCVLDNSCNVLKTETLDVQHYDNVSVDVTNLATGEYHIYIETEETSYIGTFEIETE